MSPEQKFKHVRNLLTKCDEVKLSVFLDLPYDFCKKHCEEMREIGTKFQKSFDHIKHAEVANEIETPEFIERLYSLSKEFMSLLNSKAHLVLEEAQKHD